MEDLDRFVNEQNLIKFRALASAVTNEQERRALFDLIAKEQSISRNLHAPRRQELQDDTADD